MNKTIIWIIVSLLLLTIVNAAGVCELDKYEYHPGETGIFSCECTLPSEEGAPGNFVWRNSSGTVLQTTATNSLLCRNSIFSDTYTFLSGQNFTGNVTFETADSDWVGDIVTDDFNVTGAHSVDCLIQNVVATPSIRLGELASVKFQVFDGLTNDPLVHVACAADAYTVGEEPLLFEPYNDYESVRYTSSNGEIGFQHLINEDFWKQNTAYLFEFHCYCLNDTNGGDHTHNCFSNVDGRNVGFKTCEAQAPFTTNGIDNRFKGSDSSGGIAIILFVLFCATIFLIAPFVKEEFSKQEITNLIIKRCIFLIGVYLMVLNSSIAASIAANVGLEVTKEMFRYLWLFGIAGYILMIYIVLRTLFDTLEMYKKQKQQRF